MIKLHITSEIITAKAQEKLDKFKDEPRDEPRDEHSRSAEEYRDLGLKVPKDLLAAETRWIKMQEGEVPIELNDEDFQLVIRDAYIRPDEILFFADNFDFGASVFLKSDHVLDVKESARQINNILKKYKQSE